MQENMDKQYKVKIEENPKIYSKIFWEVYKKNKIFRHRTGVYLTASIIIFLLVGSMCYLDFGNVIFTDAVFWCEMFIIFVGIGYMLPTCVNRNDVKILYKCYWKLRRDLHESGIYTEEVTFFPDKIHILEHKEEKASSRFIYYKNIKQIIFEKSGIAFQETPEKGFIFISISQMSNKRETEQIKHWYKECKEHDSNRL